MSDNIELKIETPAVKTDGLDQLLEKLRMADELIEKIRSGAAIKLHIDSSQLDAVRSIAREFDVVHEKAKAASGAFSALNYAPSSSLVNTLRQLGKFGDFSNDISRLTMGFRDADHAIEHTEQLHQKLAAGFKANKGFIVDRNEADRVRELFHNAESLITLIQEDSLAPRTGAAVTKKEDRGTPAAQELARLRAEEEALVPASKGSAEALAAQDAILEKKTATLQSAANAAEKLVTREKQLSTASGESSAAARAASNAEGELLRLRTRRGQTVQEVYGVAPGVTRTVNRTRRGPVETVDDNRIRAAKAEVDELTKSFDAQLRSQKANGAGAAELSAIHTRQANELERLAAKYASLEKVGATSIRTLANAQRTAGQDVLSADLEKKHKDYYAGSLAQQKAFRQRNAEELERELEDERRIQAQIEKTHTDYYRRAEQEAKAFRQRMGEERKLDRADTTARAFNPGAEGFQKIHTERRINGATGGSVEAEVWQRESAGLVENTRRLVERDAAGRILNANIQETSRVVKTAGQDVGYLTKNFIANTLNVTIWAASVAALYGSLAILRHGMEAVTAMDRKFASLNVVFRGTREEAMHLADDTLTLATIYGKTSDEALDAAIRFSRLGLTQAETLEAVRASLMAATVAEIDTGTAADQLAAIMTTFQLRASQLAGVINRLNAVSNTYNITNKDMLAGLSRTSSVARQAGLGLEETMSMVATISARTGRSGAEAGNAMKSFIVGLGKPELQGKLKAGFDLDVKMPSGELKTFSETIRELYLRYQELTNAEQANLVQMTAGKMQASRMTALLDGYVDSQVNAIRSLTDQTSAEREAAQIKQTLTLQIQGMITAYERLASTLANSGGSVAIVHVLTELVTALKNAMNLMAQFGGTVSIVIGLASLLAARMALTAVNMALASEKSNFFINTIKAGRTAVQGFIALLAQMGRETTALGTQILRNNFGMREMIITMETGNAAVRALSVGMRFLTGAFVSFLATAAPFLIIWAAIEGFNAIIEQNASAWEKAQQALAGYNEELDRLKNQSQANQLSVRLIDTIVGRLRSGNVKAGELQGFISAAAYVAEPLDDKKRIAYQQQLEQLAQQGNLIGIQIRLLQERDTLAAKGVSLTYQQNEALARTIAKEQEMVAAKQREFDYSSDPKAREKARKELEDAKTLLGRDTNKAAYNIADLPEEGDNAPASSQSEQSDPAAEKIKAEIAARLNAIKSIYQAFSTGNEEQRVDLELQGMREQIQALDDYVTASQNEAAAKEKSIKALEKETLARDAADKKLTEYHKNRQALAHTEAHIEKLKVPANETMGVRYDIKGNAFPRYTPAAISAQRGIEVLTAEKERLEAQIKAAEKSDPSLSIRDADLQNQKTTSATQQLGILKAQLDVKTQLANKSKEEIQDAIALENVERARAILSDAVKEGQSDAKTAQKFNYGGKNETERLIAERNALENPSPLRDKETGLALNIAAARQDKRNAIANHDTPAEKRAEATILEMQIRSQETIIEQKSRLVALDREIQKAREDQNKEAAKSLIMGDRETQIRAALAKKFTDSRGGKGFSAEEFSYLDRDTKQSLAQTNPDIVPPELRTSLRDLTSEYDTSKKALGDLNAKILAMHTEQNAAYNRTGGLIGSTKSATFDTSKYESEIASMGGVLLQGFDRVHSAMLNVMTGALGRITSLEIAMRKMGGTSSSAGRAQSAGVSAGN